MSDKYLVLKTLDAPELIGLWTLDEFLALFLPFIWGVLNGHFIIGLGVALAAWLAIKKAKAGRSVSWLIHCFYWYMPSTMTGLKITPPSHCRILAG